MLRRRVECSSGPYNSIGLSKESKIIQSCQIIAMESLTSLIRDVAEPFVVEAVQNEETDDVLGRQGASG